MADLLELVARAKVETSFLPPIVIDKPFAGGGKPNPILTALKPRITLEFANGVLDPIVATPYGDPGPSRWPVLRAGLLAAGAVLVGLALRNARRRRRR